MAINRIIPISWKGVDYKVHITMGLIDEIEDKNQGDINLMQMVDQCVVGDVRFSKVSKLLAILLQSAGCSVIQDDVFDSIFSDLSDSMEVAKTINLLWEIFAVIFPKPKKKSEGKRKRSKNTPGKISTKS